MLNFKEKEHGDIIDYCATVFILCFVIAMIFLMTGYSKVVQMRLSINNIAKEYLYKMEETGYLTADDAQNLTNDLLALGVIKESISTEGSTVSQVAYGGKVTLIISCKFVNPLYTLLSKKTHPNNEYAQDIRKILTYKYEISSTCKW